MWLDFWFGQVKVWKWDVIKAHWHECCGVKCFWNWRIGNIGRIDCCSVQFGKMLRKVMPRTKVAALPPSAMWAWQMLRWSSSWRRLESTGQESVDIHEVQRIRFEVQFCNPHKAWVWCRFHDFLLVQISTFNLRIAGRRAAVSWRHGDVHVLVLIVFLFAFLSKLQSPLRNTSQLQFCNSRVLDSDTRGSVRHALGTDWRRDDGLQQFCQCRLCKHWSQESTSDQSPFDFWQSISQ